MSRDSPTPFPVRIWRCFRLTLHVASIGAGAALVYPYVSAERRAALKKRWARQLLTILAVSVETQPTGAPVGCLVVSNHVSWLDIFAIHSVRPAAFVSKAEISAWPFLGWLAKRNDTVFLRRGSRGHARLVNNEIDALLNAGIDVAVFPEGTTTDGTDLLGFHAALLQPAVETGRPLLPLAISYHDVNGELTRAPALAGETTMKQCFSSILACRSLTVRLLPAELIETTGKTRRELSEAARSAIAASLATRRGFPAPSNQPEKQPDLQVA